MTLLERIRSFWKPTSSGDRPLTEQERDEAPPSTAFDERARIGEQFVGDDFDPDEPRAGKLD
jgi:hypothetical protein